MFKLDDVFELSGHGEEPCQCTGREICQAAGLRQNEGMLAAQLMAFGLAYVKVHKISALSGAGENISQKAKGEMPRGNGEALCR